MSNTPPLLYVEDEDSDALLVRLALQRAGLPHPLKVAVNGVEGIDYLAGAGAFADRSRYPLPCLVLLDLKLPLKDGFEVLAWIRQQAAFSQLPVILYTSSGHEGDQEKALALGATDYVVKKADVNEIAGWLRTLPPLCGQVSPPHKP